VQLADRWHTCFYDLSGKQGMLGQPEGRTADDAAYWLAGATPAWRDAVQVVATALGARGSLAAHRAAGSLLTAPRAAGSNGSTR
jgi:hypothetical protein